MTIGVGAVGLLGGALSGSFAFGYGIGSWGYEKIGTKVLDYFME